MADSDAAKLLELFTDPAALLDAHGKPVAWNDGFAAAGLTEQLPGGFDLRACGPDAADTFAAAQQGGLADTHVFAYAAAREAADADIEDSRKDWHAMFIPQHAGRVAMVLRRSELDLAFHDVVTALPNRRAACERMRLEWERMVRSDGYNFSLVVADLDNFKRVNDRLGHHVGDQVLHFISSQLNAALRGGDWVARWGGEEFVIMLHSIGLPKAQAVADRIRAKVGEQSFTTSEGVSIHVTLSMGVADCAGFREEAQSEGSDYMDIVNEAEILMYDAKLAGRDRVVAGTDGEKAYWNANALVRTLADDSLAVAEVALADPDDNRAGTLWVSQVREASALGTQHLRRSALQHGQSDKCDAAWLRAAARQHDAELHGALCFVQASANSLMKMHTSSQLNAALGEVAATGAQPVLMVNDQAYLVDLPQATRARLAELGCRLCLRLSSFDNLPTGLFNALNPSYAFIDVRRKPHPDLFDNILGILKGYDAQLLIRAGLKPPRSEHRNWLAVAQA